MGNTSNPLAGLLRPPAGLVLGSGVVALVLLSALFPSDGNLAAGATVFAVFMLGCWLLLGVGQLGPAAARQFSGRSEDLMTVQRMRADMEARVNALAADNPLRREFPDVLQRLDRDIIPRLSELLAKHDELGRRLKEYDTAQPSYRPDAPTLERLKALFRRQSAAIQGLVQQVVTMDAALLGLIQEGDEQRMVGQVREWAQEMDIRWQSLSDVLNDDKGEARRG